MKIKTAQKVFYKEEISSVENFYSFLDKKKLIVFVPDNFTEKAHEGVKQSRSRINRQLQHVLFPDKWCGYIFAGKKSRSVFRQ